MLHHISLIWHTGGWIGVDLFFVLSGFLVSGLLFEEYKSTAGLNIKRFLIRRGFKIYPAFWVLLVLTVVVRLQMNQPLSARGLVGELTFTQNYLGRLWNHTWSLAVEEHFYFALAGLFYARMIAGARRDFDWIPASFVVIACGCLGLRLLGWWMLPMHSFDVHLFWTHIRVDSLFYGVFLSWAFHFAPRAVPFFQWSTRVLVGLGIGLLSPAFVFPLERYWFVSAFGVILFYFGSGFLVIASVRTTRVTNKIARTCAALGAASYSIYIWHIPIQDWGWRIFHRFTSLDGWSILSAWYLIGACVGGYCAAILIERPVLLLRGRLYPSVAPSSNDPQSLTQSHSNHRGSAR